MNAQSSDAETTLFNTLNNNGYLTVTVLFLVLLFALSIANGVFYIRIYNQTKNDPNGTGIEGLTVTGSVVIGVISIIIAIIAIGWALYLLSRSYDLKTKISNWYTEKKMQATEFFREKAMKMKFMQACSNSKIDTATAQSLLDQMDYTPLPSVPTNTLPSYYPRFPSVPTNTLPSYGGNASLSSLNVAPPMSRYDAGAMNNPFASAYAP